MIERTGELGRTLSRRTSFPRYYLRKQLGEFARAIGPTSLVLDVGSGRLMPYRPLFDAEQYVGVDFFESAHVTADAGQLPFAGGVATVVLATEVLEHLPQPAGALQEMNRVLGRAGYLLLSVPLIWGVHDYVDYQRWTRQGLSRLLDETGFEIIRLEPRGGIFSMLGCMATQLPAQLFGEMGQQRRWWRVVAYMVSWALIAPAPWIASLLDGLDRRRDFTLGYSVLCRKR